MEDAWKKKRALEEELIKYIDTKCSLYGVESAGKGVAEPEDDDDVEWLCEKPEGNAGKEWSCARCGAKFESRTELDKHWDVAHPFMIFKCPECNQECAGSFALGHHMEDAHPKEAHFCRRCRREFGSESDLKTHIDDEHRIGGRRESICPHCGAAFPSVSTWEDHRRNCINQFVGFLGE